MVTKSYTELKQELDALDMSTCGSILFYALGWMDSIGGIADVEFKLCIEQALIHVSKGEL